MENRSLTPLLRRAGIIHRVSCPHTSEQNGIVERKHRHVVETGLTLLAQSSLPLKYWAYAFSSAVYLINRLPTDVLQQQTPHERLFNTVPDYNWLKVFGCLCFPNLRPFNSHKLYFRSSPCTFLGYSSHHKGYKCLDKSGTIIISRHVIFNEHEFPFQTSMTPQDSIPPKLRLYNSNYTNCV